MRPVFLTLATLVVVGILLGSAIVGLGLYNVSARQGHLPGVTWLLHTTYQRSVRLRAPDVAAVPEDLNDPDRIRLGALHFRNACAFCHSVPGQDHSATAMSMSPQPPHITQAVAQWAPQQMFWIVREGVKMSGMPHWPATGRDDEVWSVVAYLNAVRTTNTPETSATGRADCAACHGEAGQSGNRYIPRIDTLTIGQVAAALAQYRDGTRPSGVMQEATAGLSDAQIEGLAGKFGALEVSDGPLPDTGIQDPGRLLAIRGTDDIPACTSCHGPGRRAEAPIAPQLAGQSRNYLENQLKLWRDGHRVGGDRANLMRKAAQDLDDADIALLADWYAGLLDTNPAR